MKISNASLEKLNKITFTACDNSSIKDCINRSVDNRSVILPMKKGSPKIDVNYEVREKILLYFLTNVITSEVVKNEILDGTKWIKNDFGRSKSEGQLVNSIYDFDRQLFGNYVGVISKRFTMTRKDFEPNTKSEAIYDFDVTLQIISRFDNVDKPFFLATLLMKGKEMKFNDRDIASGKDGYFDFLLLALFYKKLKEALNKGMYRSYFRFDNNDTRLKGTIDISRHIKLNVGHNNGSIAYSYRENSVINYLNMLIVEAYQFLRRKYQGLVNSLFDSDIAVKRAIEYIKDENEKYFVDVRTLMSKNIYPIRHPYYSEYELVRKICIKILRNEGMSFENGEDSAQGIIYYMPELWEEYLYELIRNEQLYKTVKQNEYYVFDYYSDSNFVQQVRPDFVFYDNKVMFDEKQPLPVMILDAKFKPIWDARMREHSSLGEINGRSLMADYDECIRNLNAFNVHATGVVYPSSSEIDEDNYIDVATHSISTYCTRDHFYTFPIFIPGVNSNSVYGEWLSKFHTVNKRSAIAIQDLIDKEREKRVNDYKE